MKNLPVVVRLAALLLVAAQPALAQNLDPVVDVIDTVIEYATGGIGRGIAVIALVITGAMLFFGRAPLVVFLGVLVGTVLIFNAETIIDGFGATS